MTSSGSKNVDLALTRLERHDLPIHVTWQDGKPVNDADVHMGYEQTKSFDKLESANSIRTDLSGDAVLHLYGDLRVRVQAIAYLPAQNGFHGPARLSPVLEFNAAYLPRKLDLVIVARSPVP